MALEGTFQEPIEPFTALSSDLNRRLCYNDWENYSFNNRLADANAYSDFHNNKSIPVSNYAGLATYNGIAEYPLSGENYIAGNGLQIFGYTAKEAVELWYGLKSVKISFTSSWNVTWLQTTANQYFTNSGNTNLMNPSTSPKSPNAQSSLDYYNLNSYENGVVDYRIPTERVCGAGGYLYPLQTMEEFDNSADGLYSVNNYAMYYSPSNFGSIIKAGHNNYTLQLYRFFPRFYFWNDNYGYARQTILGDGGINPRWIPDWNSFHKATFRYLDAGADKDISGEIWYCYSGSYDTRASSANVHVDLEVQRYQFQNP